jgi:heterodisulfide reductase subunit A-like polyferredoxin
MRVARPHDQRAEPAHLLVQQADRVEVGVVGAERVRSGSDPIHVVGGGLAGSEAAWQIAQSGLPVVLHEIGSRSTAAAGTTTGA